MNPEPQRHDVCPPTAMSCVPSRRLRSAEWAPDARRTPLHASLAGAWHVQPRADEGDFEFDVTWWQLADIVIANGTFSPSTLIRDESLIRSDQIDHYCLRLSSAEAAIDAEDVVWTQPSDGAVLLDLSRPARLSMGGNSSTHLFVPRETLDELLPTPRDLHGLRLQGVSTLLLRETIASLLGRLPTIDAAQSSEVSHAVMHLLVASILASPGSAAVARPRRDVGLFRQASRFIELHLGDPDLSAVEVAAALRTSRASLYRVFEPFGGVNSYFRQRRLTRAYGAIAANLRRPHARVAEDLGFRSPQALSRAFSAHFGYSPRAISSQQLLGATSMAASPGHASATPVAWLRTSGG